MSVNLEEKIKKENEQLQKSESLLEKTVKKAMNFGRKPKNTQKKRRRKHPGRKCRRKKRQLFSKKDREKRKLKRGIKEKIPAGKTVQQRKKGGRAKNKRSGGAKADRCEKNACKISADGGENKIYRQVPDRNPNEKKHLKRRAPSAGADHIFGRSGRNRQKRYSL